MVYSYAFLPISSIRGLDEISFVTDSAREAVERSVKNPVSPSTMISLIDPTFVATIGRLAIPA